MSDFDAFDDSDHLPANHLINELESIKEILHGSDDADLPSDIPLLDDMVLNDLDANARLLNLNRIFEEDSGEEENDEELEDVRHITATPATALRADITFPRFQLDTMLTDEAPEPAAPIIATALINTVTTSPPPSPQKAAPAPTRIRPDYSRDVLIQELVDEFVPQIEAALRERLNQLNDAALQQWKDRD